MSIVLHLGAGDNLVLGARWGVRGSRVLSDSSPQLHWRVRAKNNHIFHQDDDDDDKDDVDT